MNFPKKKADHEIKALLKESPNLLVALEGQEEYKKSMGRLFCENDSNKPRAFFTPKTTDDVCRVLHMTRHRGQKYLCEFLYNLCGFIYDLSLSKITSYNTFTTLLLGLRLSASFT